MIKKKIKKPIIKKINFQNKQINAKNFQMENETYE